MQLGVDQFWARVEKTESCWVWTGYRDPNGYGRVGVKMAEGVWSTKLAHRVAWFLEHGDLPPELDHLCRNQFCVRPDHLEPVTHKENSRRALSVDVCKRGHSEWYIQPDGRKRCRVCIREYDKNYVRPQPDRDRANARERQRRYQQRKKEQKRTDSI